MKLAATATAATIFFASHAAHALCSYNGEDNAKTTVAQEFKDSKWVVRAEVASARDHFSDQGDSWTVYQVNVLRAYVRVVGCFHLSGLLCAAWAVLARMEFADRVQITRSVL